MIPFFEQPCAHLGPLQVCAFGIVVAASVFAGLELGRRRFHELNLDLATGEGMAWYAVVGGFAGAHLFSVLLYFPEKVRENPLILLKFWEDISSFGGMLGGLIGMVVFFRRRPLPEDGPGKLAYVDAVASVFPIALMIGRLACSLAHDHPGTVTKFPLAISLARPQAQAYITRMYEDAGRVGELPSASVLQTMGFHDLGWYEFLYLGLVIVPLMAYCRREGRRPGFFLGLFAILYMPARFALDFLRVNDVRYLGLTPAQFVCVVGIVVAVATFRRWTKPPIRLRAGPGELKDARDGQQGVE